MLRCENVPQSCEICLGVRMSQRGVRCVLM